MDRCLLTLVVPSVRLLPVVPPVRSTTGILSAWLVPVGIVLHLRRLHCIYCEIRSMPAESGLPNMRSVSFVAVFGHCLIVGVHRGMKSVPLDTC